MAHCVVPEAEAILDKEFRVLNNGFVRLLDYMGSDERIVQAARVSYGKGTKSYREDKGLISYLLRNQHTSPFEQVVLTFHIKLPVFIARQWIRHRTARLNEISGRYSVMDDDFYLPDAESVAYQSQDNKQGRSSDTVPQDVIQKVREQLQQAQKGMYDDYQALLAEGIARELARVNLPLSLYTQWYWQIDLHNLMHFLKLRMDHHAQKEIRDYANVIYEISKVLCPASMEAFDEHVLGAVKFSAKELHALRAQIEGRETGLAGKEQQRFEEKLNTGRQL